MSIVFFLVKFFDNRAYAQDFVEGRAYANTLNVAQAALGVVAFEAKLDTQERGR